MSDREIWFFASGDAEFESDSSALAAYNPCLSDKSLRRVQRKMGSQELLTLFATQQFFISETGLADVLLHCQRLWNGAAVEEMRCWIPLARESRRTAPCS